MVVIHAVSNDQFMFFLLECCGRYLGASNQQSKLFFDLGSDFGYDLCKRTNVTSWGEAATNPSGVEIRLKRGS